MVKLFKFNIQICSLTIHSLVDIWLGQQYKNLIRKPHHPSIVTFSSLIYTFQFSKLIHTHFKICHSHEKKVMHIAAYIIF